MVLKSERLQGRSNVEAGGRDQMPHDRESPSESDMKPDEAREQYAELLLFFEEERSERIANYWRLGMSLLFILVTAGVAREIPRFSVMVLGVGTALYFSFSVFMIFYLRAGRYRRPLKYVSVSFDIVMTTVCMWAFGTYRTFKTEAFLLYYIWIALATMRLSERLTLFAGVLSVACYAALVVLALVTGSITPGSISESFISPKVSITNQVLRLIYMSIVIYAVTYGARSYRALARTVFEKELESERSRLRAVKEEELRNREHLLMREMHHRTKNNLAILKSLLRLEQRSAGDALSRDALMDSSCRIEAVGSIHDMLYRNSDLSVIDMGTHVRALADHIQSIFKRRLSINVMVDVGELPVDDVVPISLIINELVTNALKYAYGPEETGSIDIELRHSGAGMDIVVRDGGRGLPPGFDPEKTDSFGMKIVTMLAGQLHAELSFRPLTPGAEFRVSIPDK